jgi:hypothetical protein
LTPDPLSSSSNDDPLGGEGGGDGGGGGGGACVGEALAVVDAGLCVVADVEAGVELAVGEVVETVAVGWVVVTPEVDDCVDEFEPRAATS